jgi:hypothetical protein
MIPGNILPCAGLTSVRHTPGGILHMKLIARVSAVTLVLVAAIAGNTLAKPSTVASVHQANVPGPTPYCNPFIKQCPPMR